MRSPREFSEDVHPDEIVHGPPGDPVLGTIAVVVSVVLAGFLLRALSGPNDRISQQGPVGAPQAVAGAPR